MTVEREENIKEITGSELEKIQSGQPSQEMSASDELDRSFIVIDPHLWIAHATMVFLILIILAWAFFGSISVEVKGKGIFFDRQGLFRVQSQVAGIVQELKVKQGELIKKGDVMVQVASPENELKLKLASLTIDAMQKDLDRLKTEIESEKARNRESILSKIKAAEFTINTTEEDIRDLKKDLELRRGLIQEGLISPTNLRDTEKEISGKENTLEKQKSNLVTLNSELEKGYRTQEYIAKEESLLREKHDRDLLQLTKNFGVIRSPFDGYVAEILVSQGDQVATGAPLILLEQRKNLTIQPSLVVYGFMPVDTGKRLVVGLPVSMEVSTVRGEDFGSMLGTISSISEFAASPEHLAELIPNKTLDNYLLQDNKAVIQIKIEPVLDPSTPSGYKWTSKKGPPIAVTSGTVCSISAVVEEVTPFYFIFPIEKFRKVLYFKNSDQKNDAAYGIKSKNEPEDE